MFNGMLKHGYLPNSLTEGTIVPLVKDKFGNISDVSNYRGITLSSTICKVLELVISEKCMDDLVTSNLKRNHSTTMCSFLVQETLDYSISTRETLPCLRVLWTPQMLLTGLITICCLTSWNVVDLIRSFCVCLNIGIGI